MPYPGNDSLSSDIQRRVLETFEQTLALVEKGSQQEAQLGCEFVLRLDPMFEPARALIRELNNSDEVRVDRFRAMVEEGGAPDLGGTSEPDELRDELMGLLAERAHGAVIAKADEHRETVEGHPELQELIETARNRMESEPYVVQFADSAAAALNSGRLKDAAALLEKARSLDGSHPRVADLMDQLDGLERQKEEDDEEAEDGGFLLSNPLDDDLELEPMDFDEPDTAPVPTVKPEPEDSKPAESAGGDRLQALLDEGQTHFDAGQYQPAIDAWSRIFLIDIDHQEATERIDAARAKKAEAERQAEEAYHEGVLKLEEGEASGARLRFERALELEPNHYAAREAIDRLDRGETEPPAGTESVDLDPTAFDEFEAPPETDGPDLAPVGPAPSGPPEVGGDLAPGPPPKAASRPPAPKKTKAAPSRRFLMIGGGVLVLVLAGAWLVVSNWSNWFPSSTPAPVAAPVDLVAQATALHEGGETSKAIARLRRVPPAHPSYAEAQALIAAWETPPEEEPEVPDEATLARQAGLLESAREAAANGENMLALELYERAARIDDLDEEAIAARAEVEASLRPIQREIDLFRQGDWEFVIPPLWRRMEENPDDPDVRRLMVNSYYNLGVRDLQRGSPEAALEKFEEALGLDGDDAEVERLATFAESYVEQPADLLYRIYVKYLPLR